MGKAGAPILTTRGNRSGSESSEARQQPSAWLGTLGGPGRLGQLPLRPRGRCGDKAGRFGRSSSAPLLLRLPLLLSSRSTRGQRTKLPLPPRGLERATRGCRAVRRAGGRAVLPWRAWGISPSSGAAPLEMSPARPATGRDPARSSEAGRQAGLGHSGRRGIPLSPRAHPASALPARAVPCGGGRRTSWRQTFGGEARGARWLPAGRGGSRWCGCSRGGCWCCGTPPACILFSIADVEGTRKGHKSPQLALAPRRSSSPLRAAGASWARRGAPVRNVTAHQRRRRDT